MSNDKKDGQRDKLLDHNYDGIQELDNQLPRWWIGLFYVTIIFAIGYYAYFEFGEGPSIQAEFNKDVAAAEARKAVAPANGFPVEAKLVEAQKSPEKISAGKTVFQVRCVSCHGDKGQGLIGPNLTDDYWIHGDGKIVSVAKTIHDGVPEKGMPPWGALLSDDDVYAVAAYVKSLRGTNPPGAKAPQGQLVKE